MATPSADPAQRDREPLVLVHGWHHWPVVTDALDERDERLDRVTIGRSRQRRP